VKLPPLALVAPSLCPRCDTPATLPDYCIACALQLRQCGACQGMAGPFDRYCGFCGNELIFGGRRLFLRWLWLLIALVPLVAGLGYGLSPLHLPAAGTVARLVAEANPAGSGTRTAERVSSALGVRYRAPGDWPVSDQSSGSAVAIVARQAGDVGRAVDAGGELAGLRPQGTVVAISRPSVDSPDVDPTAPQAVLSFQLGPLLMQPAPGTRAEIVQPVSQATVDGRPSAKVIVRITQGGATFYLERVYLLMPQPGSPPLVRLEAIAPGSAWNSGDADQVSGMARSLRPA
jgi:hypothetical protein